MFISKSVLGPSFTRTLIDPEIFDDCKLMLGCFCVNCFIVCLIKGSSTQDRKAQATSANRLPVVTPPPAWPHPSVGGSYLPPTSPSWADPAVIDNFKRQIDQLNSQLANSSEENSKLRSQVLCLQSGSESVHDVEGTLIPSQVANTNSSNTDRQVE